MSQCQEAVSPRMRSSPRFNQDARISPRDMSNGHGRDAANGRDANGMARSMTEAHPPAGRDGPRNWEHADWADRRYSSSPQGRGPSQYQEPVKPDNSNEVMAGYLKEMRTGLSDQIRSLESRVMERMTGLQQQTVLSTQQKDNLLLKVNSLAGQLSSLSATTMQIHHMTDSHYNEICNEIIKLSAQSVGIKEAFVAQLDASEDIASELRFVRKELTTVRSEWQTAQAAQKPALLQFGRQYVAESASFEDSPSNLRQGNCSPSGSEPPPPPFSPSKGTGKGAAPAPTLPVVAARQQSNESAASSPSLDGQVKSVQQQQKPVGAPGGDDQGKKKLSALHAALGHKKPRVLGFPKATILRKDDHCFKHLANNHYFQIFCNLMVVFNVAVIAMDSNDRVAFKLRRGLYYEGAREYLPTDIALMPFYVFAEFFFLVWMIIELFINLYGDGGFHGHNRRWNIFDACLLGISTFQIIMDYAVPAGGNFKVGRAMRFLRLLRIAKVMKIMRLFKYLHSVRKMVLSMIGSATSLFWALFLVFMVMFMISVGMLQGIEIFLDGLPALDQESRGLVPIRVTDVPPALDDNIFANGMMGIPDGFSHLQSLEKLYGGVMRSMLTLFAPISGGAEWALVAKPVAEISLVFTIVWLMFVCVMVFGVLNILTGIFVDAAMAAAQNDRDNIIEHELEAQESVSHELREIFQTADGDGSGYVNENEFQMLMQDSGTLALFSHLGLHPTEAHGLFKLLDEDGTGTVFIEEFVSGCIRLKGGAKAVDMITLLYENRRLMDKMNGMRRALESIGGKFAASGEEAWASVPNTPAVAGASPKFGGTQPGSGVDSGAFQTIMEGDAPLRENTTTSQNFQV